MANPHVLVNSDELYTVHSLINDFLHELYELDIDGNVQKIPITGYIRSLFHSMLEPAIEINELEEIDIIGLIKNIVIYDACIDELAIPIDEYNDRMRYHNARSHNEILRAYDPRLLLELIMETYVMHINNSTYKDILDRITIDQVDPIFHWASERLLPFFIEHQGLSFVLESRMKFIDNSYLHSYLSSSSYRVLNPTFVNELLTYGFSLSDQNSDGHTPLHVILLNLFTLSENEQAVRPPSLSVMRYKRFYRTLVILFSHATDAILRIEDYEGDSVYDILFKDPQDINMNNAREAYDVSRGRPQEVERARAQKLASKLPLPPNMIKNVQKFIEPTSLLRVQAAIKQQQNARNSQEYKKNMHKQLLNRVTRINGGNRRRRARRRTRKN